MSISEDLAMVSISEGLAVVSISEGQTMLSISEADYGGDCVSLGQTIVKL